MAMRLHRAAVEVPDVRYPTRLGRLTLVIAIVALAAGTAAASRWSAWSPLSSCLFCGSNAANATTSSLKTTPAETREADSTAAHHSEGVVAGARAGSSADFGALLPGGSSAPGGAREGRVGGEDSRHDWQPWSTRATSGVNGTDSTTLLGGFDRLTASAISGGGSSVRLSPPAPAAAAATPTVEGSTTPGFTRPAPGSGPAADPP